MRLVIILVLIIINFFSIPTYGLDSPDEILPNQRQEKKAEEIGSQLRCLVCQNESIEDSNAELARDLRKVVRQHVQAGETDDQIIQWMVDRYGNFVRLSPPFNLATALLWFMPLLALLTGCLIALINFRKKGFKPSPLNKDEEKRLEKLMKEP